MDRYTRVRIKCRMCGFQTIKGYSVINHDISCMHVQFGMNELEPEGKCSNWDSFLCVFYLRLDSTQMFF
jgi:hypothetical protein